MHRHSTSAKSLASYQPRFLPRSRFLESNPEPKIGSGRLTGYLDLHLARLCRVQFFISKKLNHPRNSHPGLLSFVPSSSPLFERSERVAGYGDSGGIARDFRSNYRSFLAAPVWMTRRQEWNMLTDGAIRLCATLRPPKMRDIDRTNCICDQCLSVSKTQLGSCYFCLLPITSTTSLSAAVHALAPSVVSFRVASSQCSFVIDPEFFSYA